MLGLFSIGLIYMIAHTISEGISVVEDKPLKETLTEPETKKDFHAGGAIYMFLYMSTFFYFTINYFYRFIAGKRKLLSLIKLVFIIVSIIFLYHLFLYYNIPGLLERKYESVGDMFSVLIKNCIPMLIFAFLFAFGTYLWESQKQRRILEAQKLQLETQISQANFNFLKAQINPHFLHNTLNFLYAKSLPYSAELSEGILTLSDVMRYALSQGHQKDGKAPLKEEIEHVQNVIKISQLRYSNQL